MQLERYHDLTFANRPLQKIIKMITYNGKDVVFAPYDEYWRQVRSIFVNRLLSNKRVQSVNSIREEEIGVFMRKIVEYSSGPLNLSKMFVEYTNDVTCRASFGQKYSDSDKGKKFLELLNELMEVLGSFDVGEYIPWLSWISGINGVDKRVERVVKGVDGFLEDVILTRMESRKDQLVCEDKGQDFVDVMLEIQNENSVGDVAISLDIIKALILDVFAGGTDTTSASLEWAMTELLRHPVKLEKVQNEVRGIIKEKQDITDNDLEQMHYLKAVIKETLRRHPPFPMLLPRFASKDVKINDCDVAVGTTVMINAYAIGRDPKSWDEPESFEPERFFNSSVDFKGLNFEFISFGAGRRGCPGTAFAVANIEGLLANVLHKFDWKLPNGAHENELDMNERPGITLRKKLPLLALATPWQYPS